MTAPRNTALLLAACCAIVLLSACVRMRPPPAPRASVYLRVEPPTASVFVDERFIARASVLAEYPVGLEPGVHRVTLTARGYFPHDAEITTRAGVQTFRFSLLREPD